LIRPRKSPSIPTSKHLANGNSTFCPGPYKTPTPPEVYINGVEVIIYIEIIENCKTIDLTETLTEYITSTCSSLEKPIWNTDLPGYPCYSCALKSAGVSYSGFITASVTSCHSPPPSYTTKEPVIIPCKTCLPYTLSTCPAYTEVESVTAYVVTATAASSHVHVAETVYPTTSVVKYLPSSTPYPTSKNNGTLVSYTGAAGRVEMGLFAVVAAILVAAVGL
jgi:hypothetical protein